MKMTKKIMSLAIVFAMVMAMSVSVFAADIAITNAVVGETYNAYKIFDVTQSGENYAYSIMENGKWFDAILAYMGATKAADAVKYEGKNIILTKTTTANKWNVTIAADATLDAKALAAHLATYVVGDDAIAADATPIVADATTITFTGLNPGYWFIDTSLGSLCALMTDTDTETLWEKNTAPTMEKKIVVDGKLVDSTDATIGDTINYQITVGSGKGVDKDLVVNDTMEAGLTLNQNSFAVKVDGEDVATTNYSITNKTENGFTITLNSAYVNTLVSKNIVITYSATLDTDATTGANTNDNTAKMKYSAQAEIVDVVTVSTYQFGVVKTTKDGTELPGAEFKLYDAATAGNEILVVEESEGVYRVAMTGETGVAIEAGKATIKGLGNGTYYLEETVAPDGYNILTSRVEVVIDDANVDYADKNTDEKYVATTDEGVIVVNYAGTELPSTGGIGTTIFYALGGLMAVGAGVLLVAKKRMEA